MPARPDRARVLVDLVHRAPTPDAALADVSARSGALAALLGDLGLSDSDWSTSGVSVTEERRFEDGREVRVGYVASERTAVRMADPPTIGRLLGRAVQEVGAEVRGPFWEVDNDNAGRLSGYRLAAEDARRRAEAYASALGAQLGAVVAVVEPATRQGGGGPVPVGRAMHLSAPPGEPTVNAGEVDVVVEVDVTFALA